MEHIGNRIIVLSLHPKWWELIKEGKKHLEIRKTKPKGESNYSVLVYITGGVGIVGEFQTDTFYEISTLPDIAKWALPDNEDCTPYNTEKASCLTKEQLKEYAGSSKLLYGWHINTPKEYERVLSLGDIGLSRPPQSWCYAKLPNST